MRTRMWMFLLSMFKLQGRFCNTFWNIFVNLRVRVIWNIKKFKSVMANIVSSIYLKHGGWTGAVSLETRCGLEGAGIEPRLGNDFPCDPDRLEDHPHSSIMGTGSLSRIKQPRLRAKPRPFSAGLRTGWGCTSASTLCPHRHVTEWPLTFSKV